MSWGGLFTCGRRSNHDHLARKFFNHFLMNRFHDISLLVLRISLGWLMLYAGITKVLDPAWSSEGYLKSAKIFSSFYAWLASPAVLPVINFVNEWALTLLGVSLILGLFVRLSGVLGAVLMLLYYFPGLDFPYVDSHSFLVDQHIIYISALLVLSALRGGKLLSVDFFLKQNDFFTRMRLWWI